MAGSLKLTDTKVRSIKHSNPSNPSFEAHFDAATTGLILRVYPTNTKAWYYRYTLEGKRHQLKLGQYPSLSLADARTAALDIQNQLNLGIDPKASKAKRQTQALSFNTLADTFCQKMLDTGQWSAGNHKRVAELIANNLSAPIGSYAPAEITRDQVRSIGDTIQGRGAYETAKRTVGVVSQIFEWAITQDMVEINPAASLKGTYKTPKASNFAHVSGAELPALMHSIRTCNSQPTVKHGLLFIAYTLLRTKEALALKWSHIDWDAGLIRLPAEVMKMDKPHLVPIAKQVAELLRGLEAINYQSEWVFYNSSTGKPLSNGVYLGLLRRIGYAGKQTTHGFRHLGSTILHEHDWPHGDIELQLSHEHQSQVAARYNHSQRIQPRAEMMQWWADHLGDL